MGDSIRLLIVEDSEDDALLVVRELERGGYEPDWNRVETPEQLDAALATGHWDVVVADYNLNWPPGQTPLELIRRTGLDLPFIVASSVAGESAVVEMMRAGARDFLTRDSLDRLPQTVRRETREARLRAERRRNEDALRQSEERYRKLFEESNDAIFVVERRTGRILDANRAAERLTGRPVHALRNLTTHDIVPGGAVDRDWVSPRATGTQDLGEVEYLRPDGSVRTAVLSTVHINDDILYGIAHDITERKRAELERSGAAEALRRGEEELRSVFSAAPTGIGVLVGSVVQSVNDRMSELTGHSAGELVGQTTRRLYVSEAEFERVGREAHRQIDEAGRGALETLWIRKDDSSIDVLLSWAPIDRGHPEKGLTFAALDISDRKAAEESLRRLAAAIEQSEEGVMITSPSGIIEYVNPAFERITGYSADEALHQHSRILRSGRQDQAFYAGLWGTIASGRTWAGRLVNRRKDGTFYHQDCTISPVFGAEGRVERYVAAMRDVTKSLQLEEDLRQAQRVESLGRLAAVVAHDFNNLLSPILGYAELLLAGLHPSDERFGHVQEIETASRRARDLTRQLLAFGRKQALHIRPVDLNAVAAGLERLLRRALREDIDLTISQYPTPCVVMADKGQAEQVVMNLAVNAQDAMPGGGQVAVRIEALELSEDDCTVRPGMSPGRYGVLVVSDTGSGMDAETKRRIFEPFFSTKGERGTGLGLSTVYGIVKQHGGHVIVNSEVGHGSVFEVYLPATNAEPAADVRPAPQPERRRASGTILLVEDNDAVRNLAETVLQREGYTVLTAAGGDEAIALLDKHPVGIDLLLTDVVMSGMDGRALHRIVMERYASAKVLFMSGYTDEVVADRGVLEEGLPFVQKPFSVVALAQKVREVLEN